MRSALTHAMRNGVVVPGAVVRLAVGMLALATVAVVAAEGPEAVRYLKMKRM
ncbi:MULTISPECIES: hypothetical protein [unclassified Streptomyces]|uniref:hypothetical protein n=1 Tax=unclassified Streptomyces TaxID=2593676 RepID=UPI001C571DBD|nr:MULTISPECIES: hypothetical protein [unclassified Streptomyces]MBW1596894.1 hypothetical protein [Streptomyces sp. JJ38]MCZ7433319.1 hypothetical protein [Streptomyces sp. WMMC1477]